MKKTLLRVASMVMMLAMVITAVVVPNAEAKADTNYYVAGSMNNWTNPDENYKMTGNSEGIYTYVLTGLEAGTTYEFKVTDGGWINCWPGSNYSFKLNSVSDVTITFDSNTKEITVTGSGLQEKIEGYYVAGTMNGWTVDHADYLMTKNNDTYTITLNNLSVGSQEFKITNGTWDEAYPSENYKFEVKQAGEVVITMNSSHDITVTGSALEEPASESESESQTPSESESESQNPSESESQKESEKEEIAIARLMGNFLGLEFVNENGERYDIDSWSTTDEDSVLEYLGNGIYAKTFKFNVLAEAVVLSDSGYKVLVGDEWIGNTTDGNNIALTIPAGSSELTIVLKVTDDEKVAFDSINNADDVAKILDKKAPEKGDFSDTAIYMVVLMGAALVVVSVVAKKKMA